MRRKQSESKQKRAFVIGFCYVIFMVSFALFVMPETGISGCSGPCYSCHPQLQGTPDHLSLGTCASCHDGSIKALSIVPMTNVNGGCGDRCFQCHSNWPKDAYHIELNECLSCHNA